MAFWLALLLASAAFAARWLWSRLKYDLHKIPVAPGAVPGLGHLLVYWQHKNYTQSFLEAHEATQEPVLRVHVAHKLFLIVADPGLAATILARNGPNSVPRKVPENSVFDKATGLHGHHSILTEQDEEMWVAVRKALSPAYTPAANKLNYAAVLAAYGDVASRISAAISRQQRHPLEAHVIEATSPCADVRVDHHMLAAAIQTQVEGLFGMSPPCGIDYLQAAGDLETAIDIVHHHTPQPWLAALHSLAPWATPAGRRLRDARLRLARDVYEPIMRHVEGCVNPSDLSLTACLRRLVDPRTGQAPSRERLLAEIGNQIMAPETAAHTISWVLYCVATHPAAEAQLLAELRSAGLPCNGDLDAAVAVLSKSFDPLKDLPYLDSVINEALRLYPAGASASARLTEKPTKVGPYLVPAGVNLLPSLFVIHNYTGNWGPDALEFKPERWQEPSAGVDPISNVPRFLPFSAGPKKCIGLALGQVVVRSAVALMLSTFTFRPLACMGDHSEMMARSMLALTLKVEGGMWLTATHRTA